jgi:hypothetical protein
MHGGNQECIQSFGGKTRKKRQLGRHRCRSEDYVKMYLRELRRDVTSCIQLAQNRDQQWAPVNMIINLQAPYNVGKFLSI